MLIVGNKLYQTTGARLQGLTSGRYHLEIQGGCSCRIDAINFPCRRLAYANFSFANTGRLLASRNGVPNHAGNFELLGCLDIKCGVETHFEVTFWIFVEQTKIALLEDRCGE